MGSRPKHNVQLAMDFNKDNKLIALEQEVTALRNRLEYLERQLRLTGQWYSSETDCQMDRRTYSDRYHGYSASNGNELPAQNMIRNIRSKVCALCNGPHPIWICTYFQYLAVDDRWKTAKELRLCYRCLNDEPKHLGRNCSYSKKCDVNHCRLTHHWLLHDPDRRKIRHRVANCFEPCVSDSVIQNDSGDIPIGVHSPMSHTPEMSVTEIGNEIVDRDPDSLNSCDGETDSQQMDELNRLAIVAEITGDLPFEMVFSGSCRDKSHSLRSEYVTPLTFYEERVFPEGQGDPVGGKMDKMNSAMNVAESRIDLPDNPGYNEETSRDLPCTELSGYEIGNTSSLPSFHEGSIDITAEKFRNSFICTTASHGTVGKSNNNVQLRDLFQTCGASKSALLLTLEDQLHRIDEEIALLSTPAMKFGNNTDIDLSLWLMPDPGGSQIC